MKKVIGITGSIGSGKSHAVKIFKNICKEKEIDAILADRKLKLKAQDVKRNFTLGL